MTSTVSVHVTFPDQTGAESIGGAVVEAGLAACVNIQAGVRSIYRWKGRIETAEEVLAIFKTRRELVERLSAFITAVHPYEVPAIVVFPIVGGSRPYLDWIEAETAPAG